MRKRGKLLGDLIAGYRCPLAPAAVAKSDMVVTLPKRIGDFYAPLFGLVMLPSPFTAPPQYRSLNLVWHKRLGHHPAYAWFRERLKCVIVDKTVQPCSGAERDGADCRRQLAARQKKPTPVAKPQGPRKAGAKGVAPAH